jgi:hypothetical protein
VPEYTVILRSTQWAYIRVEADDPQAAIEAAHDHGVPEMCAQCTGWGQDWTREADEDEWTETTVTDAAGIDVWTAPGDGGR